VTAEARSRLARAQGELMRALAGRGPLPAGFDPARIAVAARSLDGRRRRFLRDAWPELCEMLGERFDEVYAGFARARSLPRYGGALADGYALARHLQSQLGQEPSRGVRLRMLAIQLRFAEVPGGLLPRGEESGTPARGA
jgi:hypothetical protein